MGVNPNDFKSAAFGAARYLSQYKGRGLGGMLSAYNAGPGGGYQADYVSKTLRNAQSYGAMPGRPVSAGGAQAPTAGAPASSTPTFNEAGFNAALQKARSNQTLISLPGGKELAGLLSTALPKRSAYEGSETTKGASKAVGAPGTSGIVMPGHELHGLLPAGAKVREWNRKDQGRDVLLDPGQVLLATGDGVVIRNGSDPKGFGPSYPIIHLTTGPEAGKDVYYGHTDSLVKPGQKVTAGMPVARTSKTGHNAPPGWLEYGYAPGGTPGPFGQETPF